MLGDVVGLEVAVCLGKSAADNLLDLAGVQVYARTEARHVIKARLEQRSKDPKSSQVKADIASRPKVVPEGASAMSE